MWHEEGGTLGGLWGPLVSVQTLGFKGFSTLRTAPGLTLLGQAGWHLAWVGMLWQWD